MISNPQAPRESLAWGEPTPHERSAAVRVVAANAQDAHDHDELLDMLGLEASESRHPRSDPEPPRTSRRAQPHISGPSVDKWPA
jgi:hypothetical protein